MKPSATTSHPLAMTAEQAVRREAERILFASSARLIDVLTEVAGEMGLALGYAFRDIVLDRDMSPWSWPLADILEVLAAADVRQAGRAAPLITALSELSGHVDALEIAELELDEAWDSEAWEDDTDAPSIPRAA